MKSPLFITTSFLVTSKNNEKRAYSIIDSKFLEHPNQILKLKIQQFYWNQLNVKWKTVTDTDINWILARNVEFLHSMRYCFHYEMDNNLCRLLINRIKVEKQRNPSIKMSLLFNKLAAEWDAVTPGILFFPFGS